MRKKVLVLEDNRGTRLLLANLLTANGYEVIEAEHGKHAAQLLRDGLKSGVILTDWIVPGKPRTKSLAERNLKSTI